LDADRAPQLNGGARHLAFTVKGDFMQPKSAASIITIVLVPLITVLVAVSLNSATHQNKPTYKVTEDT
jgi:hypothetical protein